MAVVSISCMDVGSVGTNKVKKDITYHSSHKTQVGHNRVPCVTDVVTHHNSRDECVLTTNLLLDKPFINCYNLHNQIGTEKWLITHLKNEASCRIIDKTKQVILFLNSFENCGRVCDVTTFTQGCDNFGLSSNILTAVIEQRCYIHRTPSCFNKGL